VADWNGRRDNAASLHCGPKSAIWVAEKKAKIRLAITKENPSRFVGANFRLHFMLADFSLWPTNSMGQPLVSCGQLLAQSSTLFHPLGPLERC